MSTATTSPKRQERAVTDALHAEIERVPPSRRGPLLKIVHAYREAVEADREVIDPRQALRQALREVKAGKTRPIEGLWERVGL
jgi:hypothetical protein